MKIALVVDGKTHSLEVDLAAGTARLGDRTFAVKVPAQGPAKVEVEVEGERLLVEAWYQGTLAPTDPVAVNGEQHRVRAEVEAGTTPARPPPPATPIASRPRAEAPTAATDGAAVVPPMPGKVVELRVAEGETVRKGQVLLVLEAMKMRNEVTSPADGRVVELRVSVGSNVRAREAMLKVASAA